MGASAPVDVCDREGMAGYKLYSLSSKGVLLEKKVLGNTDLVQLLVLFDIFTNLTFLHLNFNFEKSEKELKK